MKAILHNDEVVKRHCLSLWIQRARKVLRERRLEVCDPLNTPNRYFSICILNSLQNNEVLKWHRLISDMVAGTDFWLSGRESTALFFWDAVGAHVKKHRLWHTLRQKFSNSKFW